MPTSKRAYRGVSSVTLAILASSVLLFPVLTCQTVCGQATRPAAAVPAARPNLLFPYDEKLNQNRLEVQKVRQNETVVFPQSWPVREEDKAKFFTQEQAGIFDSYYRNYHLARWVLPENASSLPAFRKDLLKHFSDIKTNNVHTRLTNIALEMATKMATASDAPIVRINAALMMGELSEDIARPGTNPTPSRGAVTALVSIVESKEQTSAVRAAALAGLLRQTELGIRNPEVKNAVQAATVKIVTAPPAATPMDDATAWIKASALGVLAALGDPGEKNAVADLLGKITGDADMPLSIRRAAARGLGRLSYKPAELDATALATSLGKLAVAGCRQCKVDVEAGRPVSGRQLKSTVGSALVGLRGPDDKLQGALVLVSKNTPHAEFVAKVYEKVEKLVALLDQSGSVTGADLVGKTEALTAELAAIVEK